MANCLKRYWFKFDFPKPRLSHYGYIPPCGCCGITAFDYDDALKIMHRFLLRENEIPIFNQVVENVDVSAILDKDVHFNLGVSVWRGVWYPAYNLWQGAYTER
ncbi:MAG: hypothetical protein M3033_02380 [Acidobacteriota bacterium]|nr:hypothetical protein [Acidobacteriota bacterium]